MAAEFSKALDDAMDSNVWDWKGETRNIVDTGELKKAKVIVDSDGDIHVFMALIMRYRPLWRVFLPLWQ